MKLETPHLDYISKYNLDIANSSATSALKRGITKYNNNLAEYEKLDPAEDDEENKKLQIQWYDKLTEQSKNLLSDLEEQFPEGVDIKNKEQEEKEKAEKEAKEKAEKEKAEKEAKAKAEKEAKEQEEKEKSEKEAKEKAEKEKASKEAKAKEEKEKAEKEAKEKAEKEAKEKEEKEKEEEEEEEEEETPSAQEINENVLKELWPKLSENGEMKITEDDLSEAGFKLGECSYTSDQFGEFRMKKRLFSETWTITKEKVEVES